MPRFKVEATTLLSMSLSQTVWARTEQEAMERVQRTLTEYAERYSLKSPYHTRVVHMESVLDEEITSIERVG